MTRFDELHRRVRALISRCARGQRDDATRDALLRELMDMQAVQVSGYRDFLANERRRPRAFGLPALPTDAFRFTRIAAHPASRDIKVFRTSGTTASFRGQHAFADLSLYDHAAYTAARHALFPDCDRIQLVVLAPNERELPDSSLSYMLARFVEWFGTPRSCYVWQHGQLQLARLCNELADAQAGGEPVALLGTSFAFVHAEDGLQAQTHDGGPPAFQLPPGSRIMQTGGFKGRSRSVEPAAMLELLSARYGVPASQIVQEYGMTELSSQCYESTLRAALLGEPESPRRLWVPGWVRAEVIDPDTLEPVGPNQIGLLRIDDLANLGTACAIQTSDLARRDAAGLVVLGRAPDAVARGCSITVDAWLGG